MCTCVRVDVFCMHVYMCVWMRYINTCMQACEWVLDVYRQRTAPRCNTLRYVMLCVAACCSLNVYLLHYNALLCVLQFVAAYAHIAHCNKLWCALQFVAGRCSMNVHLPDAAAFVAVCCKVLQCDCVSATLQHTMACVAVWCKICNLNVSRPHTATNCSVSCSLLQGVAVWMRVCHTATNYRVCCSLNQVLQCEYVYDTLQHTSECVTVCSSVNAFLPHTATHYGVRGSLLQFVAVWMCICRTLEHVAVCVAVCCRV